MNTTINSLLLFASLFFFFSCNQNKKNVQVDIKNIPAQRVALEEIEGSSFVVVDSTKIAAGKPFTLSAPLSDERMYRLTFEQDKYIMLALEKGDMLKVVADWDQIEDYSVSGSQKSETVKRLVAGSRQSIVDLNTYKVILDSLTARGDEVKLAEAQNAFKQNNQAFISYLKQFADTSTSVVASLMAVNIINPKMEAPFISKFYKGLAERFPNNKMVESYTERFVGSNNLSAAPVDTKQGNPAPDFEGQTPDGKTIRLSDYQGKYVLIDFWASWCGPCRAENPAVVKAYEQFKAKNFDVLGVSLDTDKDNWIKAIAQDKLAWKQISELKGWSSSIAQKYRVNSIPANFLVDPQGYIIASNLRGETLMNKLKEVIK